MKSEIEFKSGLDIVFTQGKMLTMLPLEEWLASLERADSIAHITDPTTYHKWIYSINAEVIPEVLRAAIVFKQAILKAQQKVREDEMKKTRAKTCLLT
jgi:hypothetical protein